MKLLNNVRGLLLGSLVLCSSATNAAMIEFDDYATSFTNFTFRNFEDVLPGIDLKVEAAIFSNNSSLITNVDSGTGDQRRYGLLDDDGLGVVGYDTDLGGRIDGNSGNDLLIFTFSEAISFTAIDFSDFGNNDDFEFGFVDGDMFNRVLSNEDVSDMYTFSEAFYGTSFGIGAVQSNDSFRIDGIAVVPEPSTIALFALGLAGLGLRRRFSK